MSKLTATASLVKLEQIKDVKTRDIQFKAEKAALKSFFAVDTNIAFEGASPDHVYCLMKGFRAILTVVTDEGDIPGVLSNLVFKIGYAGYKRSDNKTLGMSTGTKTAWDLSLIAVAMTDVDIKGNKSACSPARWYRALLVLMGAPAITVQPGMCFDRKMLRAVPGFAGMTDEQKKMMREEYLSARGNRRPHCAAWSYVAAVMKDCTTKDFKITESFALSTSARIGGCGVTLDRGVLPEETQVWLKKAEQELFGRK